MWPLRLTAVAASLCVLSQTAVALPSGEGYHNSSFSWNISLARRADLPTHLGCFENLPSSHSHAILTDSHLIITECASYCAASPYFGISETTHCSCYEHAPSEHSVSDSECSCSDSDSDTDSTCSGRTTIYVTPRPHFTPFAGHFHHEGCYTDSRTRHSLTSKVVHDPSMTPSLCADICSAYPFFGVEYGTQCFCGLRLSKAAHRRGEEECAMRCGGDKKTVCGGADRMNVYHTDVQESQGGWNYKRVGPFGYKGCWTDSVVVKTLGVDGGRGEGMTLEGCAGVCGKGGYRYMGVEFGSQCWCGDDLKGGKARGRECRELCSGNKEQLCGGANRLSLYERFERGY
ncbi:WSC domain-containing protein [Podospora conica]|nr:WSC domain-containing protein [Schizothecium conicum]